MEGSVGNVKSNNQKHAVGQYPQTPPPPPNYAGANDTETSTNQIVEITHKLHITKVDQKVFNALTDTKSSQSCYVCSATPKQFNNLSSFPHPKNDTYKYGISPIHNWICCFEMLIHISYRIEVQKWWISAEDQAKVSATWEEQFFLAMYPSLMHIVRIQMVALNDSMQSLSDYLVRPIQQVTYTKWIPASKISLFRNVFKLMDVSSVIIPRDEPFHSPASSNMILKLVFTFHTLVVARSGKRPASFALNALRNSTIGIH